MAITGEMQATSFTRMDESTREQGMRIVAEEIEQLPEAVEPVIEMLEQLARVNNGFGADQQTHSLQTAARAQVAGVDEELVVAALCHDVGKVISVLNHPRIAAEIRRPYVRDKVFHMVAAHQDFLGRHCFEILGLDPAARERDRGEPWYELAETFAEVYDQTSFDPEGSIPSLSHFEPMVRRVLAVPRRA
jgi:predicted HD phosphohydrolase